MSQQCVLAAQEAHSFQWSVTSRTRKEILHSISLDLGTQVSGEEQLLRGKKSEAPQFSPYHFSPDTLSHLLRRYNFSFPFLTDVAADCLFNTPCFSQFISSSAIALLISSLHFKAVLLCSSFHAHPYFHTINISISYFNWTQRIFLCHADLLPYHPCTLSQTSLLECCLSVWHYLW